MRDKLWEALWGKYQYRIEKIINIRLSDYRFADKKKYYMGYVTDSEKSRPATGIIELKKIAASKDDYWKKDIFDRKILIIDEFIYYLTSNDLLVD